MQTFSFLLCCALLAITLASSIPQPETEGEAAKNKHMNRPYDKDLSDDEHYDGDMHNFDYDHEAFLGKDDAHMFDDLSPEESKERLSIIFDKIDKDADSSVSETELREWIKYVQHKYVEDDTKRQWEEHEPQGDGTLTWASYKERTYGFAEDDEDEEDDGYSYKDMIDRDEKRWKVADLDDNGVLSIEEFTDFLHPEDAKHMRDIVIDETVEDIDKNGDGLIDLEEYIEDMWPAHDRSEDEPEWVTSEKQQFKEFRDKDGDGKMSRDEVADWILPEDYDHSDAEAKHLIFEADLNKDGKLTRDEVLEKYDVFVGSQATDFGEALTRHDEF